ncbi:hypothetical protein OG21DRAFT_1607573 [Imleria badia]|nr:hypothetical protein OG21DRAFT_1607573 [Imleria badia]
MFRKEDHRTLYEPFEVVPHVIVAPSPRQKIICSYPELAIEIPNNVFDDEDFRYGLANFHYHFNEAESRRDSYGRQGGMDGLWYSTEQLTGVLRSIGSVVEVTRITKGVDHQADRYEYVADLVREGDYHTLPGHREKTSWSRSSAWLLIRVTIQLFLDRSLQGRTSYKTFILFFLCGLANHALKTGLSSDLLHLMSAKLFRRLRKLGSSVPRWLSDVALQTCMGLRQTLHDRWMHMQTAHSASPWDPSQLDFSRDTELPLCDVHDYIINSLTGPASDRPYIPFLPSHHLRGDLDDFLSLQWTFFEDVYHDDPHIALYDVERGVEQGIDDWIACTPDVNKACVQLETLTKKYLSSAGCTYAKSPEDLSIMVLTMMEFWIALDKLVVKELPMLADYSPEHLLVPLERLFFREATSLHRLCCAYQYLSSRKKHAQPGYLAFSDDPEDEITFPIYELESTPPPPQHFKVRIEDTPVSRLGIKVAFKPHGPVFFNIWCSVTKCLLEFCYFGTTNGYSFNFRAMEFGTLIADIPELQSHPVGKHRVLISLDSSSWRRYDHSRQQLGSGRSEALRGLEQLAYQLPGGPYADSGMQQYLDNTTHTSNEVLSAQVNCHMDLSLHEFISFGHLRSGGSLQWMNILRELRSRTLNFRHPEVHLLFTQACTQVGPLGDTGDLAWHRELRDASFCCALLDELESLFVDVGAGSSDGPVMATISLLTCILASSPSDDIVERAIELLRNVRGKTFDWLHELLYDWVDSRANEKCSNLLRDMAAVCRSTFDVGPAIVHKILCSAQDIEVALSCAILIRTTILMDGADFSGFSAYSRALLERNHRLGLILEGALRNAIQADVSDVGVDLAVRKVWSGYRAGSHRWKPCQDAHWISCETPATSDRCSQTVQVNILDGSLLVDGKPIGDRLPAEFRRHFLQDYYPIIGNHADSLIVVPSDLPGMDFVTLFMISDHYAHFSLRGDNLVIRAQRKDVDNVLELIPKEKFAQDLPTTLVEHHAHWLDLSTSIIEIRPLDKPWKKSPENWCIHPISGQYRLFRGRESLVDIASPTWAMVSRRLACLDISKNLIITTSPIESAESSPSSQLSVALPRYGLSFFINQHGELESRDFKDMVYDENQCIGTLFGLVNRLVLRTKAQIEEDLIPRCILIPVGECYIEKHEHHVRVTVNIDEPTSNPRPVPNVTSNIDEPTRGPHGPKCGPVMFYTYKVDSELGCLTGIVSLKSRLYLASLHAMTSNVCRPDPLTGRTGLEEAISLTWSAGLRLGPFPDSLSPQSCQLRLAVKRIRNEGLYLDEERSYDLLHEAYLFPSEVVSSLPTKDSRTHPCDNKPSEDEDIAYTIASAVQLLFPDAPIISDWIEVWGDMILRLREPFLPSGIDVSSFPHHDLSHIKRDIYDILRRSGGGTRYFQLQFFLPTIDCLPHYGDHSHAILLSLLVAFAKQFHIPDITCWDEYDPLDGCCPEKRHIRYHIENSYRSERHSERFATDAAVDKLLESWPSETVTVPTDLLNPELYDVESLTENLQRLFSSCYRNFKLKEHFMRGPNGPRPPPPSNPAPSRYTPETPIDWQITLDRLLLPPFQHQYVADLDASASHCHTEESHASITNGSTRDLAIETLRNHYALCRVDYKMGLEILKGTLGPKTDIEQALDESGPWPRVTPYTLFRCLATTSPFHPSESWTKCLVSLALLALELQRARRLLQLALDDIQEELLKEFDSEGCEGWLATEHPDWLLMQLQGNFLIRRVQADVAREMIFPQSRENIVMQVNMGEGKSSVIIPICVVDLADGHQLVRVIVPEPLKAQTLHHLADRLGGLVDRPIYNLSFSRSDPDVGVDQLWTIMSECLAGRGVVVMQPEHILSLKLTCVEKQLRKDNVMENSSQMEQKSLFERVLADSWRTPPSENTHVAAVFQRVKSWLHGSLANSIEGSGNIIDSDGDSVSNLSVSVDATELAAWPQNEAEEWFALQRFLHFHARDLLDESDEILHSRFQLIYTSGREQPVEGFPDRWTITQQILGLVNRHLSFPSTLVPYSIECDFNDCGSFPHIRVLHSDAGMRLISLIAKDVVDGYFPNISFSHLRPALRSSIRDFITRTDIPPETAKIVEACAQQNSSLGALLLLRGLLANNILLFAITERRWRVDYGLDLTRTPLAVPFRAKDVPASTAEFGHPDITILLTCLSYYYAGLSEEQLRKSFEVLFEQDDPSTEYERWLDGWASQLVPAFLRNLSGVNIRSPEQWNKVIFPLFTRNQAAIDYYLSRVVFPKYAKEFPWKILGSSWDIAERRHHLISGFSGTNDAQYLLPTSIVQHDPAHLHQTGTNARVLAYLLRPENNSYTQTMHESGERWATLEFLKVIVSQKPEVSVLLDVGAQILDVSNRELAKAWLDLSRPDIAGAIYFSEDDELVVLARNGTVQPLSSSPLVQKLNRCVAYLDDAHTRGTDIKFPSGSRAAVILGPNVTKDRLVQGCMRMRKLGHGHSVMFFAPPEVDRSIRSVAAKDGQEITTTDILHWTIHETWTNIVRWAPYWTQQGMNHKSRRDAWSRFCNNEITTEQMANSWLQPELKSLADLYTPRRAPNATPLMVLDPEIRQRCERLGVISLPDARMDEEQEREISRELEREREVEHRSRKVSSAEHYIHRDVANFVRTGVIPFVSTAFRPIFTTLGNSSAPPSELYVWSPYILATADFCETIVEHESSQRSVDEFLRSVQWVLSGKQGGNDILVLVSPFEADRLISEIRLSNHVHLHLYTPTTIKHIKPCDNLKLYSVPPVPSDWTPPWALVDQLNIFAGQLYLRNYTSYVRLSHFLGVPTTDLPGDAGALVRRNWFKIPGSLGAEIEMTFDNTQLPFMMMLLAIRRRGMGFAETHMGRILQGQLLTEADFQRPEVRVVEYHRKHGTLLQ